MSAYIKLQNFVAAAQQAYDAQQQQHLVYQGDHTALLTGETRPSNSLQVLEQNKQTWKVFLRCLIDVLGPHRVDEICRRYRLNPDKMEREGLPLLSKHVEMFSAGASRVTTRDIKQTLRGEGVKLKTISVQTLSEQFDRANPFPLVGWAIDPQLISGAPSDISSHFFHNPLLMDKERQILLSNVHSLSFFAWRERFCKTLVNKELAEKQVIPAPGANGRVEYYKVYRKITTGDGLMAYALAPLGKDATLKPILFFRPTQFAPSAEDAIESYMNDFQPSMGEMGYSAAKSLLDRLMEDPKFCPPSKTIEVAGYSLGGVHAQRFILDHWPQVSEATFHNDPSEVGEEFAQKINDAGPLVQSLRLNIIRSVGDLADCVGKKHVGWGITNPNVTVQVLEVDHQNKSLSVLDLHGVRVFDTPYSDYRATWRTSPEELNTHLDNEARGPAVFGYEKLRRFCGGVFYVILYAFRTVVHGIHTLFGVYILRSTRNSGST